LVAFRSYKYTHMQSIIAGQKISFGITTIEIASPIVPD